MWRKAFWIWCTHFDIIMCRVGEYLSKYTAGKIPKAFKHIPSMQLWEEVLYLTEPQKWSPNAMYQATRIFSSSLGAKKAERFYRLVLLPRVRDDIRTNKRLHFSLYQALKCHCINLLHSTREYCFPCARYILTWKSSACCLFYEFDHWLIC